MTSTRQKLGQNFLIDRDWQERIVEAFRPKGHFGEIGPGHGELTQHLAHRYSGFVVFEMDRQLVPLHETSSRYSVIAGDFLDWNFEVDGKPVSDFSFIGNLPYESGTAILKRIIEHAEQVNHFVFMLQKEVVDRITAKPRTRDYGSLSIFVQGQYKIEKLGTVPPGCFRPPPKVVSEVFVGSRRNDPHPMSIDFSNFLMKAFGLKRKTLKNNLRGLLSPDALASLYKNFGWSEMVRAEEIECDLWPEVYLWIRRFKND